MQIYAAVLASTLGSDRFMQIELSEQVQSDKQKQSHKSKLFELQLVLSKICGGPQTISNCYSDFMISKFWQFLQSPPSSNPETQEAEAKARQEFHEVLTADSECKDLSNHIVETQKSWTQNHKIDLDRYHVWWMSKLEIDIATHSQYLTIIQL